MVPLALVWTYWFGRTGSDVRIPSCRETSRTVALLQKHGNVSFASSNGLPSPHTSKVRRASEGLLASAGEPFVGRKTAVPGSNRQIQAWGLFLNNRRNNNRRNLVASPECRLCPRVAVDVPGLPVMALRPERVALNEGVSELA